MLTRDPTPEPRITGNPDTAVDNLFALASSDKNKIDVPFVIEILNAWQSEVTESQTILSRMGLNVQTTDRENTAKNTNTYRVSNELLPKIVKQYAPVVIPIPKIRRGIWRYQDYPLSRYLSWKEIYRQSTSNSSVVQR